MKLVIKEEGVVVLVKNLFSFVLLNLFLSRFCVLTVLILPMDSWRIPEPVYSFFSVLYNRCKYGDLFFLCVGHWSNPCVLLYVKSSIFPVKNPKNFEDWVTNHFGKKGLPNV